MAGVVVGVAGLGENLEAEAVAEVVAVVKAMAAAVEGSVVVEGAENKRKPEPQAGTDGSAGGGRKARAIRLRT